MRALGQQQATLESVRGRAGVLLSAATISTFFFGAQALGQRLNGALPHRGPRPCSSRSASASPASSGPAAACYSTARCSKCSPVQRTVDTQPDAGAVAVAAIVDFVDEVRQHVSTYSRRLDQLFLLLSTGWVLLIEILIWLVHALSA